MIIKLLSPSTPEAAARGPWVAYARGRDPMRFIEPDKLDATVRSSVRAGSGKAFFHAELSDGEFVIGAAAPWQEW